MGKLCGNDHTVQGSFCLVNPSAYTTRNIIAREPFVAGFIANLRNAIEEPAIKLRISWNVHIIGVEGWKSGFTTPFLVEAIGAIHDPGRTVTTTQFHHSPDKLNPPIAESLESIGSEFIEMRYDDLGNGDIVGGVPVSRIINKD